ncbi:MAG TPA: PaaI family thioesterase [Stenotrophobium sp.]|nr:PaaI family thioesterase [Stenotrophobium sp.]
MPENSYHQALGARFSRAVPHVRALGIHIVEVCSTQVTAALPYRDDWLGDPVRGLIHTGVITTLVDSASGLAVLARLERYEPVATLDLRMDYLRPALRDLALNCRAECYRLTAHIAFVRASVWQDDAGAAVATSQSVFMLSSRKKQRTL